MWSSRPFAEPTPFISGPRTALLSWDSFTWGREIWFTSLTLDVGTRKSTGKGAMFAHSGFWADPGQISGRSRDLSALDRRAQPSQRLGHSPLQLVGMVVGPTEEQRREGPGEQGEAVGHGAPLDHPRAEPLGRELVDPASTTRAGVPGECTLRFQDRHDAPRRPDGSLAPVQAEVL